MRVNRAGQKRRHPLIGKAGSLTGMPLPRPYSGCACLPVLPSGPTRECRERQMLGRPGEAWGGESGTERLVVVRD